MSAFRFDVDGLGEAIFFEVVVARTEVHSGSVLTEDTGTEICLYDGSDALW